MNNNNCNYNYGNNNFLWPNYREAGIGTSPPANTGLVRVRFYRQGDSMFAPEVLIRILNFLVCCNIDRILSRIDID